VTDNIATVGILKSAEAPGRAIAFGFYAGTGIAQTVNLD
jgi:hypothetical protein